MIFYILRGNMAHKTVSRWLPYPGTNPPLNAWFLSHFWPPPAMAISLERAKIAPHHLDTCVTSLWVQPMPKMTINVVARAKIVTKRQKMAILWPFWAIRESLMALTLMPHQYLLPPMIWSEFYHFRISGSIVCRQIFHSFTDVRKVASPFRRTFGKSNSSL